MPVFNLQEACSLLVKEDTSWLNARHKGEVGVGVGVREKEIKERWAELEFERERWVKRGWMREREFLFFGQVGE